MRRRIGHVFFGVVRRLPVRAHVGAVESEVAGMTRPAPVVDVAAILADGVGRRIYDAHVANLQALDQLVLQPAEKRCGLTAIAGFRLAFADHGLAALLDLRETLARRQRGVQSAGHPLGDVVDLQGDIHARPGSGRELFGQGRGEEAVLEVVVLAGGVELNRTARAMMVGDHQAIRRHERGGAAAQRDDRPHRERGQIGQRCRVQIQSRVTQIPRDARNLLRREHAFLGQGYVSRKRAAKQAKKDGDESLM